MRSRKEIEKDVNRLRHPEDVLDEKVGYEDLNLEVSLDTRAILLNVNKLLLEQRKIAKDLLSYRSTISITK